MHCLDPELYRTLDRLGTPILAWVATFATWTAMKTVLHLAGREVRTSEHMVLTELPGLPLMLVHSVGFVLAILHRDPISTALFAWWGPGYLAVVALVLTRGSRIDWRPWAALTSWGCKLSYLVMIALYGCHDCWTLPFAFSVWIIGDQIRLAWFNGNADRARRVREDWWIVRLLYPGLLLLPWFVVIPGGTAARALGLALLGLWVAGLGHVARVGRFGLRPDPATSRNLRDIVYLDSPGATGDEPAHAASPEI